MAPLGVKVKDEKLYNDEGEGVAPGGLDTSDRFLVTNTYKRSKRVDDRLRVWVVIHVERLDFGEQTIQDVIERIQVDAHGVEHLVHLVVTS